ncbi:hypothetical protein FRB90_000031 [Tulasnella sp. 427]|nr:hypothetical protein FRB90_000031 [Tulasnella sp. 427]
MATAETRPFSSSSDITKRVRNYSGLENQTIAAICIGTFCLTTFELMRRKRRNTKAYQAALKNGTAGKGLGSVESWEWGYLYQGRCWAKRPSPPLAKLPLAWVKQMITFPEHALLPLIGPDSTVYARFLRGAWYFTMIHTFTTLPVLLPIHLVYAPDDVPKKSMTRASLSSLIESQSGQKLLVVHLIILAWLSTTWIGILFWICRGAFRYRRQAIKQAADKVHEDDEKARQNPIPGVDEETRRQLRGWRLRTVMVTNLPSPLRDEKLIKEYFEFYLALVRSEPPAAPGLIAGVVSFFHRFAQARAAREVERDIKEIDAEANDAASHMRNAVPPDNEKSESVPVIDKVVVVRKMTELASLLERREDILKKLEEAHIALARKTLEGVQKWIVMKREGGKSTATYLKRMSKKEKAARRASVKCKERTSGDENTTSPEIDVTNQANENATDNATADAREQEPTEEEDEEALDYLAEVLKPYLEEFGLTEETSFKAKIANLRKWLPTSGLYRQVKPEATSGGVHSRNASTEGPETEGAAIPTYPPPRPGTQTPSSTLDPRARVTIWEVLHTVPRHYLDAFQPLIRLNSLFRGATVPAIDYYTTKLGLLTALINESRSRPTAQYIPASTAFVTFADPADAQRAVKILPSHPKNPLACLVTPAPEYGDLDWSRLMTKTFTGEFLKDWVVDLGVWVFTCFWIIPVTLLVSLVSINNLSALIPGLGGYLNRNPEQLEVISTLVPTLLVTGLAILVPLILLLISKKAHNIVLLSKLHDQIMTRYHKFLVCNVLIFFCVGVSALHAFLASWKQPVNPLQTVATKFPDAAPFYVGWLIFQTAMHAGLELGLLGLPLLVYPATVLKATTPRRRKAGTRPRTFNFYYWLPNHLIVLFVVFCFSILNPLVIPFAFIYFSVASVVFKHQFLHVYSKAYEMNASVILIRWVRYSLDGIILSQVIFLALTIILKKDVLAGFAGLFIGLTVVIKLYMTSFIRANFAIDQINEGRAICGVPEHHPPPPPQPPNGDEEKGDEGLSPAMTREHERLVDNDGSGSAAHPTLGARINNFFNHHPPYLHKRHHRSSSEEHHSSVRFWTWKLPSGAMQFAYTTLPARPGNRHPPNPFRPQRQPSPSPAPSINRAADETAPPPQPPHPGVLNLASPQPAIYTDPFDHAEQTSWVDLNASRRHDLVMPHEKRQAWDDAPRYDLTYENPHYTRPIENILWLPVNPCAIFDLNETVDVFRAITSEPGAGALGQWINETSSVIAEPAETRNLPIPGTPDPESELDEELTEIPLFGTERIDLPPTIESRIESSYKDKDAENPESNDGPSLFGLARASTRRMSSSISMTSTHAGPGGRSFSGGTLASVQRGGGKSLRHSTSRLSRYSQSPVSPTSPAPPSNSIGMGMPSQSPVTPRNPQRMQSVTSARSRIRSGSIAHSRMSYDPFDHVDLGSQTPFADPNLSIVLRSTVRLVGDSPEEIPPEFGGLPPTTLAVPGQDASGSHSELKPGGARLVVPETPSGRPGRARSNSRFSVTAREALVGEVLAEEQLATTERVKKESQESVQNAPRSWVTSWLYNTLRHDDE